MQRGLFLSDPDTVTQTLIQVLPQLASALKEGSTVIIDERGIRVRPLPIR